MNDGAATLTIREVADHLKCTVQHVHHLIESGRLQAFNIASDTSKRASWRIPRKALEQFINAAA